METGPAVSFSYIWILFSKQNNNPSPTLSAVLLRQPEIREIVISIENGRKGVVPLFINTTCIYFDNQIFTFFSDRKVFSYPNILISLKFINDRIANIFSFKNLFHSFFVCSSGMMCFYPTIEY